MNSTQEMMSQGIKPLPNTLAKRSGIIALAGLAIGGGAAAIGGTIAGTKKAWHAGDRTKTTEKIKGLARIAVIPVTSGGKAVGKFINPKGISTAKYNHEKSMKNHKESLQAKFLKHQNKASDYKVGENNSRKTVKNFKKSEKIKTQQYHHGFKKHDDK